MERTRGKCGISQRGDHSSSALGWGSWVGWEVGKEGCKEVSKKNCKEFFWGMAWGRGAARGERKAPLSTTKGKGEIMTLPPPPNNKADQMGGK